MEQPATVAGFGPGVLGDYSEQNFQKLNTLGGRTKTARKESASLAREMKRWDGWPLFKSGTSSNC